MYCTEGDKSEYIELAAQACESSRSSASALLFVPAMGAGASINSETAVHTIDMSSLNMDMAVSELTSEEESEDMSIEDTGPVRFTYVLRNGIILEYARDTETM